MKANEFVSTINNEVTITEARIKCDLLVSEESRNPSIIARNSSNKVKMFHVPSCAA